MTDPIIVEKIAVKNGHDEPERELQQHGFQPYPLPDELLHKLSARAVWIRVKRKKDDAQQNKSDIMLSNTALRALTRAEAHQVSVAHAKQGR